MTDPRLPHPTPGAENSGAGNETGHSTADEQSSEHPGFVNYPPADPRAVQSGAGGHVPSRRQ
ncbi:MAG: hypothetical protein NTX68_20960, partial [Rhodococcus sp.]